MSCRCTNSQSRSPEPLVCMDETSKQHVKETRLPLPCRAGDVEKYDYEYERNGVSNLFIDYAPADRLASC